MLVNTSFNVNNEPIVEMPFDAIKTFINTNLDYLIIDNLILSKEKLMYSNLKDNKIFGYDLNATKSKKNIDKPFVNKETNELINYNVRQ